MSVIGFNDVCGNVSMLVTGGPVTRCLLPARHGGGCHPSETLGPEETEDVYRRSLARYEAREAGRLVGEHHDPGDEDRSEP